MSDQYIQAPLFYTEEEVTAKVNEAVNKHSIEALDALERNREIAINRTIENMQRNILTVLRATELVDRETAIALYNEIADYYGWVHASVLTQYEVEVTYSGNVIGTFTVEAEDDDAAVDLVQSNMDSEATMTVTLSHGDEEIEGEVYLSDWELTDHFEYRVWEA
jgi:hypothetical protein